MSGVKLSGDWSRLEQNLHRLVGMNFTALHKEIGEHLVASTQERFRTQTGPDGEKWPPSLRVRKEGGRTLRLTGRLRNSITCYARPDRVEVGTNDKRARLHQLGGIVRPKSKKALKFMVGGRWAVKRSVKMPARPFLGISDDDLQAIEEIISDALEERLK